MPRFPRATRATLVALAVALCSTQPAIAHGQSAAHYIIAAGASLPTGTLSDGYDVGFHALVGVEMAPHLSPLAFRAEGMYNEFKQSSGSDKVRATGIIANAVYELSPPPSPASASTLYGIAGLGFFGTRTPAFPVGTRSETNLGWNIGGGFRFPLSGFAAYVEARYHSINSTDINFVPITFGLVF